MTYLGLLFEILIFAAATYGYLFTRGMFSSDDPTVRKKANDFRKKNGWWLRLACILVMALMAVNIALHIRDIFA